MNGQTQLQSRTKRFGKRVFQLIAVAFAATLIFLAAVPLFGPGWHLIHGNSITYDGWRVPVPRKFFVTDGSTMWKFAFGVPYFKSPFAQISIFDDRERPYDFRTNYSLYQRCMIGTTVESGYSFKAQRTVRVGQHEASCWEFEGPQYPRSAVRCIVDGTGMGLFYSGDPRYVPRFYEVLADMSHK